MKNYLKLICLIFILFMTPISAQSPYSLHINGIPYELTSPLISKNDTIYIALPQLASLTFSELNTNEDIFTLNFQDKIYKFRPNQSTFDAEFKSATLTASTFLVGDILYVPFETFDYLNCSYEIQTATRVINLTCPTIYSPNSDTAKDHTYIESVYHLKNLPEHILSFTTKDACKEILDATLTNKDYISFVDNSNKDKVVNYLKNRLTYSPYNNITVSYRIINTHAYPNKITDTITLPLKVDFYGDNLRLQLNDTVRTYPVIWATYYPSHSLTQMDLQKSVDSTLMHALYEYYRNEFDLKDDKYFKPYSILTSSRTNQIVKSTYSLSYEENDSLNEYETNYTVKIQRVHPSGQIRYIIDIYAD
nr:hypothetical protein [uncultured Niameybacter sp.]